MIRDEEESENRRQTVKQRISEILSDEKLPESRETFHYLITKKFEDGASKNEIEDEVRKSGELLLKRKDVTLNLLNALKEL